MGVYRTMKCLGQVLFLQIYPNVWKNSVTIHWIIFQDTNWHKKFFQEIFDSIPIKALWKISAVKRLGNDLNFIIEFYEKVAKMSQIIQISYFSAYRLLIVWQYASTVLPRSSNKLSQTSACPGNSPWHSKYNFLFLNNKVL